MKSISSFTAALITAGDIPLPLRASLLGKNAASLRLDTVGNGLQLKRASAVVLPHTSHCKWLRDGPANVQGERKKMPRTGLLPALHCLEGESNTMERLQ